MAPDPASRQDIENSPELLKELAASVPGILFSYWLSADTTQRRFPFISSRVHELFGISVQTLTQDARALFPLCTPKT